jgi:predicted HicB family RNase H-like nuclease
MNDILEYKSYYATVQFSAEDEVFYGKIIGINDLVSFEGTTVTALKKAFREAVDDYLETCKQLGKEPEKTYKGSFNVRIPSELHRQAARYATAKNMSLNDFVRYALDAILKEVPHMQTTQVIMFIISVLPALAAGFLF